MNLVWVVNCRVSVGWDEESDSTQKMNIYTYLVPMHRQRLDKTTDHLGLAPPLPSVTGQYEVPRMSYDDAEGDPPVICACQADGRQTSPEFRLVVDKRKARSQYLIATYAG